MNDPFAGLHDTYFIRATFFEEKEKIKKSAQERHPTDDDTYLKKAQRGLLSSAPGIRDMVLDYSNNRVSSTRGESKSVSQKDYKGIDLSPIVDYSTQRTSSQKGNSGGINYGPQKSLYSSSNYYQHTPKMNYR